MFIIWRAVLRNAFLSWVLLLAMGFEVDNTLAVLSVSCNCLQEKTKARFPFPCQIRFPRICFEIGWNRFETVPNRFETNLNRFETVLKLC